MLRSEALNGVPLYERTRGEYAEAQIAAVGECRDTAWMRRRNLELMAFERSPGGSSTNHLATRVNEFRASDSAIV